MRAKVITDGREAVALVSMSDYLQLNGGSADPLGSFWKRLGECRSAGEAVEVEAVPAGSLERGYIRQPIREGLYYGGEEAEAAAHAAGYDTCPIPEEVAELIRTEAERLAVSVPFLIGLITRNRERPDSLCITDVRRGISLAENSKRRAHA